jgi:branched-subunit amino acid transport protein
VSTWAAVLLAGLGSYCFRFGVVAMIDRWNVPAWHERSSRYVMPASFAGLAAGALLARHGGTGPDPTLLVAAVATAVVTRRWSPSVGVGAGMVVIWVAQLAGAVG